MSVIILAALFVLLSPAAAQRWPGGLRFLDGPLASTSYVSPTLVFSPHYEGTYNVTGLVVSAIPPDGCDFVNSALFANKVVVGIAGGGCSPQAQSRAVKKAGGLALILVSFFGPPGVTCVWRENIPNIRDSMTDDTIGPLNCVSVSDGAPIYGMAIQGLNLTAHLTAQINAQWNGVRDPSDPWFGPWTFLAIFINGILLYQIVLAVYKGVGFWKTGRRVFPLVIISLEFVVGVLRLVSQFDLIFMYGIWNQVTVQVLLSIHFPISIMTTMLISLFWLEVIMFQRHSKAPPFLSRLRIPFFIVGAILFVQDLVNTVLQGLFIFNAQYAAYIANMYIAVQCLNFLMFTITGSVLTFKMAKLSHQMKEAGLRKKKRARDSAVFTMMLLLVGSAVGMLLYLAGAAMIQTPLVSTDGGWYGIWFLIEFGAITTSLFQLHAMQPYKYDTTASHATGTASHNAVGTTSLNATDAASLKVADMPSTASSPSAAVLQSTASPTSSHGHPSASSIDDDGLESIVL